MLRPCVAELTECDHDRHEPAAYRSHARMTRRTPSHLNEPRGLRWDRDRCELRGSAGRLLSFDQEPLSVAMRCPML
jgi:hypothetical protein